MHKDWRVGLAIGASTSEQIMKHLVADREVAPLTIVPGGFGNEDVVGFVPRAHAFATFPAREAFRGNCPPMDAADITAQAGTLFDRRPRTVVDRWRVEAVRTWRLERVGAPPGQCSERDRQQ